MTFAWKTQPMDVATSLNARNVDAGALVVWSGTAAESLLYLKDLDDGVFGMGARGGQLDVIDTAHFRWAASTSVTALDLGAAAAARLCGIPSKAGWEMDLKAARTKLTGSAQVWINHVWDDPDYQLIRGARNPMVHRRLGKHYFSGSPDRTQFRVRVDSKDAPISTPELIDKTIRVTAKHLEGLFAQIISGKI